MNYRKVLVTAGALLIVLGAIYFAFRNTLLTYAFNKAKTQIAERYHLLINAGEINFRGIDGVVLDRITVIPENADTLATIQQVKLNISLWDLCKGRVGFDGIIINDVVVSIYNDSARNNISTLFPKKIVDSTVAANKPEQKNYYDLAESLKAKVFRILNTAFEVNNAHVRYTDSAYTERITIPHFNYDLNTLSGVVINSATHDSVICTGEVVKRRKQYRISLMQTGDTYLPFMTREGSLQSRFQALDGMLTLDDTGDELKILLEGNAADLRLNHWRIAPSDVILPQMAFSGAFTIGENLLQMDSSSILRLNSVPFQVYLAYNTNPTAVFTIKANMPETAADSFFHSLPEGMFRTLEGISCSGTLAYNLNFSIDTDNPDSLVFESELKRKDFRINHFGEENYGKINGTFPYTAYEKGAPVRSFLVGEGNPNYTLLQNINPYLPMAVMQSEDPSFMLHRGFLPEAFRESIVQNYKEKRFARGGSTISMQLVKNVFLNRNKTISRKVEEALIVYMIENLGLSSKNRMLEVYLNLIEWGPNVYGITEASRFYFGKYPSQLSLQESIFLAGIIPRPKYFKYQFDKEGKLKPYLSGYFNILSRRMVRKGWIPESDTIGLQPDIQLRGPALNMVVPDADVAPDFMNMFEQE